jgi:hypothetical protein
MRDDRADSKQAVPHHDRGSPVALRAIDACVRALQRLRKRFEAREDEEAGGGKPRGADTEPVVREAPPRRIGFLVGLLIVLASLLVGVAAGSWGAYRGMTTVLAARAVAIDRLQEEIDISKSEQARSVNQMIRFQKENAELRLHLLKARRESVDDKARIDELEKQSARAKRLERPPAADHPVGAASPRSHTSGRCAVGTGSAGNGVAACIEQFNRK